MKNLSLTICLTVFLFSKYSLNAQQNDTIQITSANITSEVLKEGTFRYLVYFKMQKDSVRTQTQFWTRSIKRTEYKGSFKTGTGDKREYV